MSAQAIATSSLDRHSFILNALQDESQKRAGGVGNEKERLNRPQQQVRTWECVKRGRTGALFAPNSRVDFQGR